MQTNLIFKRSTTVDGEYRVETKIIPVNIPQIEAGEGWTLSGHTDTVEVVTLDAPKKQSKKKETKENTFANPGDKYISNVAGSAKLVRVNDTIKIAYRVGKSTLNQNTPNSVCIADSDKQSFFRCIKAYNGGAEYIIKPDCKDYDYWNKFIDQEYERARKVYNSSL